MSSDQVLAHQSRTVGRNVVTDFLFGAPRRGIRIENRTVPGPAGTIPIRVYRPLSSSESALPLIVYLHGGGWVFGSLTMGDWICTTIASDLPATVVSVEYRLAPAHRFPDALEDSYGALGWAARNAAELGADAGRLGVLGESAGANMAAVICLMARDNGGPAIGHQALLYPIVHAAADTASLRNNANAIVLTAADKRAFCRFYLGLDRDQDDWRVSPLLAGDHRGLPPALVVVAGHDPLRDEGIGYAETLRTAGTQVTLAAYPAMPHGFIGFPRFCRDAEPAVARIVREQRQAFCT
jgi:acetyl esterase